MGDRLAGQTSGQARAATEPGIHPARLARRPTQNVIALPSPTRRRPGTPIADTAARECYQNNQDHSAENQVLDHPR